MPKPIQLKGQRFGKLVVLSDPILKNKWNSRKSFYICQCDCGNQTEVMGDYLKKGDTKSCGCLQGEKHGQSASNTTKEYRCWCSIKTRCFNSNYHQAKDYSEKGITMCEEWRNSFTAFYNYVGDAPGKDYSIDRIDNNGNYEPGNVRWVKDETGIQNINQGMLSNNTSGVKGVYWHKSREKWMALITVSKRRIYLGSFKDKEDAIKARKNAELKYHSPLLKKVAAA